MDGGGEKDRGVRVLERERERESEGSLLRSFISSLQFD